MNILARRVFFAFGKWSRPKAKTNKVNEDKKSFAVGDDKAAKLSKSQQEMELKQKLMQSEKSQLEMMRKLKLVKAHDVSLEQYLSQEELGKMKIQQYFYLKGVVKKQQKVEEEKKQINEEDAEYLPTEQVQTVDNLRKKKQLPYGNYVNVINKKFNRQITQFQGNWKQRRVGSLGRKLGMTMMWNHWGHAIPVTVIELDRVQVVQKKQPVGNNEYYQVQMGMGQKSLKRINKAMLGHFVKARVPPKRVLAEFRVSKECLLPVGFMIGVRHYTPGMYVDVVGRTVGHGFQGTIKRWGFRRQPATHGNSLTTRVLGSTGGRQDPGRVFKQKKMYGHMGNKITCQKGLQVFKIDCEKNLLYLKGSVPGKAGTIVKLRDTLLVDKAKKNLDLVSFPTFLMQQGVQYANEFSMYCGERDEAEMVFHDNSYIVDDGDDEVAVASKESQLE